jgi:large repetitive protein
MRDVLTYCVTLCFLLLPAHVNAGTGDLDPTFGTGGIARLSYAEGRAVNVKGSAKLQDGRIVVVGDITSPDDGLQHVFFARLNNDGTLDTTFGNAGWTIMVAPRPSTSPYPPASCSAAGVAPGNGTITALATCDGSITLFSVNLDGTPNVNFGSWYGSGSRIDEYGAQLTARAIAVDSQGRIIVGGSRRTSPTTTSNAFMKRYLSNGVGDVNFGSAFGMAGLSTQSLALGDDELLALAVDATDRIVGVGYGTASLGGARFMLATRFQANGQIGPFGYTNQNFVSYTGEGDTAHAVALESGGTIVVAGTASYTHWNGQSSSKFYVWRMDTNGYTTPEGAVAIDMPLRPRHCESRRTAGS